MPPTKSYFYQKNVYNIHEEFNYQRERTSSKSFVILISLNKDPLKNSSMARTPMLFGRHRLGMLNER